MKLWEASLTAIIFGYMWLFVSSAREATPWEIANSPNAHWSILGYRIYDTSQFIGGCFIIIVGYAVLSFVAFLVYLVVSQTIADTFKRRRG